MFFGKHKRVLCPYCLTEIRYRKEIQKCPSESCGQDLPRQYVTGYEEALPFFVQMLGWSSVGKTTYLQALTAMLMYMGKFWGQDYSYAALTEPTLSYVRNVREFQRSGMMPPPTQLQLQEAFILKLLGMSRWGGRTLVTRDVAGEHFKDLTFPLEYMPYLLHVPTTFLMISPEDLRRSNMAMDELLGSYIETMAQNNVQFRKERRKAVVIVSKADKIFQDLPANLQEYLQSDPMLAVLDRPQDVKRLDHVGMQEYMNKLGRVSQAIRDWIIVEPSGQNLVALAKNNNIHLEFTLISSTGADVDNTQQMTVNLRPVRVLDPYFWALDFQSRR